MVLAAGTRFGTYQVTSLLGVGGMGEVYRATDTALGREVAIKVLPGSFAADADRTARFEREAKTLAKLNHANIGQIFGLERRDGTTALVMELVEGVTLAHRLMQGPIPVDQALNIAMQMADALEAAHTLGIVHRDLKPANIKLRPDGTVKVLDFGIAKALSGGAISGPEVPAPTAPAETEVGIVLGTAGYMSPEQARGQPVDQRADIWAFACVLYEMLTGRPAFGAQDVTATLARVLERDPDMTPLPRGLAPAVPRALELCFKKDPRRRLADIRDVRLALEGQFETAAAGRADDRDVFEGRRRVASIAGAVLGGAALVGLAALSVWPEPEPKSVRRFAYALPEGQSFTGTDGRIIDLSPDGRSLVYNGVGGLRIWDMATLEDRAIRSTEEALFEPAFSPDAQSIAFVSGSSIYSMAATGGPAFSVAEGAFPSWATDGTILFLDRSGIWRVSGTGGTPELVVDTADILLPTPRLLPDGDTVLFSRLADSDQVIAQSIATGERTVITNLQLGATDIRYVPTGHLVYVLGDTLFGIAFDARTKRTVGNAVPLVQGVSRSTTTANQAQFAIANDGTLAYVRGIGGGLAPKSLAWVDRSGRETRLHMPARNYTYVEISPDGTRLALDIRDQENDIWVYDLERETLQRLTFDPGRNRGAIWADDRRIAFSRQLGDREEIYWQAADGSGAAEALTQGSGVPMHPIEITGDGTLLYTNAGLPRDIFMIPVAGPAGAGTPLLDDPSASEGSPTVSPDGSWLAYSSNESGDYEVYVRPFPDVDAGRWQISTGGGVHPQWSRDGRELFYLNVRSVGIALMAVAVDAGEIFRSRAPVELFQGRYYYASTAAAPDVYDVHPDGQRFLMITEAEAGAAVRPDIVIVQNWFEELERLVPTK
jgi:serine/threonine-protein kinase